jgi:hypothetical protein
LALRKEANGRGGLHLASGSTIHRYMSEPKANPLQFDLRVRPRFLKDGSLQEKDLQKYLGALPDMEASVESFSVPQPALDLPDDEDDEDEDDAPLEA